MEASQPSMKQKVRDYMEQRRTATTPPESMERIREILGFPMLEAARKAEQKR